MTNKNFFISLVTTCLILSSCAKKDQLVNDGDNFQDVKITALSDQYIVVLKQDAGLSVMEVKEKKDHVNAKAIGLLKKYAITGVPDHVYETALQGFAMKMSEEQATKMMADSTVKYIEADQMVTLLGKRSTKPVAGTTTTVTASQNTPWGITRVGGGVNYTGSGVAWVIDSGIDLTHPDLHVDASRGICYVTGISSPNDDNGHGTHVAGTIAAINNSYGVVGVAAGATVIPVKVLDSTGSGTFSGVLSGINYVLSNGKAGDVANMSLGGGISPTIDDAVLKASSVVKFAIAAGNETDNANNHSPARANGPNIYTVSAMASGDSWASFSNFSNGPVDYCAPGVSIYSTYKGGGYVSMSGTSMAAPHVAGLLLLGNLSVSGYVKNDPDGIADPIASR